MELQDINYSKNDYVETVIKLTVQNMNAFKQRIVCRLRETRFVGRRYYAVPKILSYKEK